jgi:hypothetical protein
MKKIGLNRQVSACGDPPSGQRPAPSRRALTF